MIHNEHVRSPEILLRQDEQELSPETRLSLARMEESCTQREKALSSLEHDISVTLYKALRMKLRYERASLLENIHAATRAIDAKQRPEPLLKTDYFTLKPLSIDIL